MKRIRNRRLLKASQRTSTGDLSSKRKRDATSLLLAAGSLFLASVGYLSAGDKINDLAREWGGALRNGFISTGVAIPQLRGMIVSRFVSENFGDLACVANSGAIDLDKDGRTTDIVVVLSPSIIGLQCNDWERPSLVVLKNVGWKWYSIELLEAGSSSAKFSWYRGYIFLEIAGTDFPNFIVYALRDGEIQSLHSDFGELPSSIHDLFAFSDRYSFQVSGRNKELMISYDAKTKKYALAPIERRKIDRSRLHVISSRPSGWSEGYAYDGEEIGRNENGFRTYLGELDLVFVPTHCDTKGLISTPGFPGYYRTEADATEIRVCCPIDVEEYGSCEVDKQQPMASGYLSIELQ